MDSESHKTQANNNQHSAAALSDKQIFQRVLQGEKQLFELIMRRYNRKLFRIARSVLKSDAEAEDALQESYILAYSHMHEFNGPLNAGAWLAKITINESLGRLRRSAGVKEQLVQFNSDYFSAMTNQVIETTSSPEYITGADKIMQLIESAIDKLPRNYRTVFVLRAVEQLSVDETAEYLNINPATVKTRFHRAKSLLKKSLDRHVEAKAVDAFSFGGKDCDHIVANVFKRLANH